MAADKTPNTQQWTAMSGSGTRMMQVDATGNASASLPIITGKLADSTAISLLTTDSNWSKLTGLYSGTAITGTYEGQYYQYDDSVYGSFLYLAYSDNAWIRYRVSTQTSIVKSLTDSNESEGAGSYFDLLSGKSGRGSIVFGDGAGYADFIFTTAGVVTPITKSANVFETLQTGTNHVIIKDNGSNVRITNELGATTTFTIEIKYTV